MQKKGFVTRAIQDLEELRNENPRSPVVRIQLGLLHYAQENILDAELEWEGALNVDPTNREARGYLDMLKKDREISE